MGYCCTIAKIKKIHPYSIIEIDKKDALMDGDHLYNLFIVSYGKSKFRFKQHDYCAIHTEDCLGMQDPAYTEDGVNRIYPIDEDEYDCHSFLNIKNTSATRPSFGITALNITSIDEIFNLAPDYDYSHLH